MNLAARLPIGRQGQMLAVAILFAGLALLWLEAGQPLLDWYAAGAVQVAEQRALAERMAALADRLPALEREARLAGRSGQRAAPPGDTDALAAAALQQRVVRLARNAGTELSSVETLPPSDAVGLRHIGLRISLTATWPVLLALFRAIETDSPALLIDDLGLRTDAARDVAQPAIQAQFSVTLLLAVTAPQGRP